MKNILFFARFLFYKIAILSALFCHSFCPFTIESTLSAIEKYAVVKHIIDIYKLNDTREDDCIAVNRSKNHSCILGIKEKCSRCGVLCPLDLATALKDKRGNN